MCSCFSPCTAYRCKGCHKSLVNQAERHHRRAFLVLEDQVARWPFANFSSASKQKTDDDTGRRFPTENSLGSSIRPCAASRGRTEAHNIRFYPKGHWGNHFVTLDAR